MRKGYLLYDSKAPSRRALQGFDLSAYAVEHAKEEIRDRLFVHRAQDPLPYGDKEFDLVLSITTLYNLKLYDLQKALVEIERVGRDKYVVMESYRNDEELFNLQCWALTCECFLSAEAWVWIFGQFGYSGDYEFIYFE